jgi:hypothetical protein
MKKKIITRDTERERERETNTHGKDERVDYAM